MYVLLLQSAAFLRFRLYFDVHPALFGEGNVPLCTSEFLNKICVVHSAVRCLFCPSHEVLVITFSIVSDRSDSYLL